MYSIDSDVPRKKTCWKERKGKVVNNRKSWIKKTPAREGDEYKIIHAFQAVENLNYKKVLLFLQQKHIFPSPEKENSFYVITGTWECIACRQTISAGLPFSLFRFNVPSSLHILYTLHTLNSRRFRMQSNAFCPGMLIKVFYDQKAGEEGKGESQKAKSK